LPLLYAAVPPVISHHSFPLSSVFDARGIAMRHRLFRGELQLPWSAVDFVSPIPAAERVEGAWRFKDLKLPKGFNLLLEQQRFVLEVVVKEPSALKKRLGWPWGLPPLRHLTLADDRLDPDRAYFALDLKLRCLSAPAEGLLELIARNARFDLLCHSD
jgi:hypothetical protein